MSRTLEVALGTRSYPIHIGAGTIGRAGELLQALPSRRAVVVTNAAVASHWLAPLRVALAAGGFRSEVVLIPDGESHKSLATLSDVLTRLLELAAERQTTLIALGGGVVGDLAGFAAAIYQRGMPFVQVPTTLLAQVDSSVGGKTAVNHPLGKNMIGAFWQPRAVLIDTDCLRTLPDRELAAGTAEVIKAGAIRDRAFLDWLDGAIGSIVARDAGALEHAIFESCRIKAEVVAADEHETGERALAQFRAHVRARDRECGRLRRVAARRGGRRRHGARGPPVGARRRLAAPPTRSAWPHCSDAPACRSCRRDCRARAGSSSCPATRRSRPA